MTKIVGCMGTIYKLSDRNYRRLLQIIAAEGEVHWETLGRELGLLDMNVTDLTPEEARGLLKDLEEE